MFKGKGTVRAAVIALIIVGALAVSIIAELGISFVEREMHPIEYEEYVTKYASEYNIPEYIIYAIINVESGFDPEATSHVGAMGLMQMMPDTFTWLSSAEHLGENLSPTSLYEPEVSIRYGVYYLRYLFDKFHDWNNVYAAYNGGEGNVAKWLEDSRYSDGKGNLTYVPFKETRNYVKKVKRQAEFYKNEYYKDREAVK
jgi:soluble lytic murein transglycosylase